MSNLPLSTNELDAMQAFDRQAPLFDQLYQPNSIIQYKRERVWSHVESFLSPHSLILELNSGTGEDAIHFAKSGHLVHATDLSAGMQEVLKKKVEQENLGEQISTEICSFTSLANLHHKGPYDLIFSNFAGLNCTNELDKVLGSFVSLVRPGGIVTLVILPPFCLWEFLLLFKGKFKTATRRFVGSKGSAANVEGIKFKCWYYSPDYIVKHLKNSFKLYAQEGLCTLVPPSYIENFTEKHPKIYRWLVNQENKKKESWPWKSVGDYYIITLQKI